MRSLVSSELLKLATTRTLWLAAAVAVGFAALIPLLASLAPETLGVAPLTSSTLAEMLRAPIRLTGAAALLVGLLGAAGEFSHGTMLTTRLVEPRAGRVLVAKLAASAVVGLVLGLVVLAVAGVVGVMGLLTNGVDIEPLSHGLPRIALIIPFVVALHGLLGVAVGFLLRSTAAAVGATLLWFFVVEGVVPVVTRRAELADWLPGGAVERIVAEPVVGRSSPAMAAAVLLGYVVGLAVVTLTVERRREL